MAKVVKQEEIKKAKDGLDVWDDIHRYAQIEDYSEVDDTDFERFKWYGLYRQRPNEGDHMLRIKIPGGALTAEQLREIGKISQEYGKNIGDVSTRQAIQLHWLRLNHMPDIFDRLYNKIGLFQEFSCGDAPRNTTCCPLAGELAESEEIVDALPFVQSIQQMYKDGGREFSNLPRKFKTAAGGCRIHCHEPQINCVSLYGVERQKNGQTEKGFGLVVGGGLRDTPHYAQSLRVFIPPDMKLINDIYRSIAHVFRDQDQLRQGRLRARLKFYVAEVGWEAFRNELEKYLGYELEHDDSLTGPENPSHDDHMGIGDLKNGLKYVGIPIQRGRLSGDQMVAVADLAEKYCQHEKRHINTTIKQNLILLNIKPEDVDALCGELDSLGLPVKTPLLRHQLLSCTGIQFCNLAVVETKDRAKRILDYLEEAVTLDEPLMISVTGCPNSCVQYQIADIGLSGTLFTYKGEKGVEHYHMLVGGRPGVDPKFGQFIVRGGKKKVKVPAELAHKAIENLIKAYQAERVSGEKFWSWSDRQDMERLADLVDLGEK